MTRLCMSYICGEYCYQDDCLIPSRCVGTWLRLTHYTTNSLRSYRPFADAVRAGVGSVMCSYNKINNTFACENSYVLNRLLKNELGFQGVAISECLEMEGLRNEIGVKTGTVMAVEAGCDLVLLCRAYDVQLEAIAGLKLGVENELITKERIYTSLERIFRMKKSCTSWQKAWRISRRIADTAVWRARRLKTRKRRSGRNFWRKSMRILALGS